MLYENLYIIPLIMAFAIAFYGLILSMPKKNMTEKLVVSYDGLSSLFNNYISNTIYEISFKAPFVWFIPEDPECEKAKSIDSTITKAGYTNIMNYRVLQAGQFLLLIFAFFATLILGTFIDSTAVVFEFLFNIKIEGGGSTYLVVGAILMLLALVPRLYINTKASSNHSKFVSDLPVLQLFIILMIRSKRTVPEIFFVLSKSEMRYKDIFSRAYRIFLRDRQQAFVYLRSVFYNTPISDSLSILETFDNYSKEESAQMLDNQLESIIEEVASLKKNKNVLLGLLTEGSIALPFASLMVLGVVPIIVYGLNAMTTATNSTTGLTGY